MFYETVVQAWYDQQDVNRNRLSSLLPNSVAQPLGLQIFPLATGAWMPLTTVLKGINIISQPLVFALSLTSNRGGDSTCSGDV